MNTLTWLLGFTFWGFLAVGLSLLMVAAILENVKPMPPRMQQAEHELDIQEDRMCRPPSCVYAEVKHDYDLMCKCPECEKVRIARRERLRVAYVKREAARRRYWAGVDADIQAEIRQLIGEA